MAITRGSNEAGAGLRTSRLKTGAPLNVLPPSSRRQQVVDLLREAIISAEIPPGAQLKQDVLCAQFGTSPGPVREALRQLESEGLVEHFPNHGVFVSEVSESEFLGVLLPVRIAIEAYAVPLAAERMTPSVLSQLEAMVEAIEERADAGDLHAINELDVRFHELTVQASGSPHAVQLWRTVSPRIRTQIYRLAPRHRDLHEIAAEHKALLAAIETGDRSRVLAAVEHHIVGTARHLLTDPKHPV
jgi:GntR family transcriptional regulator of gluconate operon